MWPFTGTPAALISSHLSSRDAEIDDNVRLLKSEPLDVELLSLDVQHLASAIAEGKYTSEHVMRTYVKAAINAHQRTRCLTEVKFTQSIAKAKELDAILKRTGKTVGPLHGVPFSIKDCFDLEGRKTTTGYSSRILLEDAKRSAGLAAVVEHLGAITFCKTNIPQTMLAFECKNPLWGRSLNPWSPNHTCGGSSGGEAALLACDGSASGWGSDIGGSLRIPVGYSGIYSLKPTKGRFPSSGQIKLNNGFEGIPVVTGPMCRSAEDVEFIFRTFIGTLHPQPGSLPDGFSSTREWQRSFGIEPMRASPVEEKALRPLEGRSKPLRIGYYLCDGFTKTSPACIRAVREAKAALEAQHGKDGAVEMVEIDPSLLRTQQAMAVFLRLVSADQYKGLLSPLKHADGKVDKREAALFLPVLLGSIPAAVRWLITFVLRYVVRDRGMANVASGAGSKSAGKYIAANGERLDFADEFEERIFDGLKLDGIIAPVQAIPAIGHDDTLKLSLLAASTILYNVIDSAVTIVPVTRCDKARDNHKGPSAPKDWAKTKGFETCSWMAAYSLYGEGKYDAEKMHGLPVAVQVIARRNEEEKAIGLMRILDDALAASKGGKRAFGPGKWAAAHPAA